MNLREFRLYIEGVQVPFIGGTVNSQFKELPTAAFQLPPHSTLSTIGKNYRPKVHLFYLDPITQEYILVYEGICVSVSESKYVDQSSGSRSLTIQCEHPFSLLRQILIRFGAQNFLAPVETQVAVAQSHDISHEVALFQSLRSVEDKRSEEESRFTKDKEEFRRLQGTPGVMKVYWERLNKRLKATDLKDDVTKVKDGNESKVKSKLEGDVAPLDELYKELVDNGLAVWDKLTGHPVLESSVNAIRVNHEKTSEAGGKGSPWDVIIPMKYQTFLGEQSETAVMVRILVEGLQSINPEVSSFYDFIMKYLELIDYSLTVLSTPTDKGIEYIMNPTIPAYYAPICNVLLPSLVESVDISSNFESIPSRVMNVAYPVPGAPRGGAQGAAQAKTYVAPDSVRQARGGASGTIKDTLHPKINAVGKYEKGTGIIPRITQVPPIYNNMGTGLQKSKKAGQKNYASGESEAGKAKAVAENYWKKLYDGPDSYNPFSGSSGIDAWTRMMILWVDQQYDQEYAKARTGQAVGTFNPFAVVGYPMDVVDPSAAGESYHGLCVGIQHSFNAQGQARTSYSLASVTSLSEMHDYRPGAVPPSMALSLGFEDDPGIYANPKAYEKACEYYVDVLGVGAAEPALLQDRATGLMREFGREDGVWTTESNYLPKNDEGKYSKIGVHEKELAMIGRNTKTLKDFDFISIDDWAPTKTTSRVDATGVGVTEMRSYTQQQSHSEASPYLDY